jgi:hypothetical protein
MIFYPTFPTEISVPFCVLRKAEAIRYYPDVLDMTLTALEGCNVGGSKVIK